MINLNQSEEFHAFDPQQMLAEIDALPDQLEAAWKQGLTLPLAEMPGLRQVIVTGMGGSAIGADLLAAYAGPVSRIPLYVLREYDLPAWAQGSETLVIASSHSGNTEETLSAFLQAQQRGCRTLAVCTGGQLAGQARAAGAPLWLFEHAGQPRAAVGYSFGLLLAAFYRLGGLPDPSQALQDALTALRIQQAHLRADVPLKDNPAKRSAGQLCGRMVCVMASNYLAPVARRWKGQVNELAKGWAQFELLPEADHNTVAGVLNPEDALSRLMILFLRAPSDHPRNRMRSDLTRRGFMVEGLNTDCYDAQGEGPLAHMWTALHFGDYLAYYLAMCCGVDPTPVAAIEDLKQAMR